MSARRARAIAAALVAALLAGLGAPPAQAGATMQWGLNVWNFSDVGTFDSKIGVKSSIVGIYRDWVHSPDFPSGKASTMRSRGGVLLIAWEPWDSWKGAETDPNYTSAQIASGRYDTYIKRWAGQAKTYGGPVMIRLAPEQNGTWRPWSIGKPGNSPAEYIAMWRHVVNIFRAAGATNVQWVWNPYVDVGGSTPMFAGYPGDAYVTRIGLDGFNWGGTRPWGWQSYDDIFATSVALIKSKAPTRPWFIAEAATARGSARAAWVTDTVARAKRDGSTALVWFEFNKETDWRLSNDPTTCAALRKALAA
jgi:beta-mannanase